MSSVRIILIFPLPTPCIQPYFRSERITWNLDLFSYDQSSFYHKTGRCLKAFNRLKGKPTTKRLYKPHIVQNRDEDRRMIQRQQKALILHICNLLPHDIQEYPQLIQEKLDYMVVFNNSLHSE